MASLSQLTPEYIPCGNSQHLWIHSLGEHYWAGACLVHIERAWSLVTDTPFRDTLHPRSGTYLVNREIFLGFSFKLCTLKYDSKFSSDSSKLLPNTMTSSKYTSTLSQAKPRRTKCITHAQRGRIQSELQQVHLFCTWVKIKVTLKKLLK